MTGTAAEKTELSFGDVSIGGTSVQLKGTSKALQNLPCSGIFQCRWKDQGWGNQRGKLYLKLMAPDGTQKASFTLTEGLSPHEWEDVKVDLKATDSVLAEATVGCWYEVNADEGNGNGHEIYVQGPVLSLEGENQPVCGGR